MNNFKTKVDLDLSLDRAGNYDVVTEHVNLRWDLEIEMRQYGIKSFIITVPDQTISVDLNVWGDEEDHQEEIKMEIKDVVVERNGDFDGLVPRSLEYYKGQWKLVFA
jgi:hypothetical protein